MWLCLFPFIFSYCVYARLHDFWDVAMWWWALCKFYRNGMVTDASLNPPIADCRPARMAHWVFRHGCSSPWIVHGYPCWRLWFKVPPPRQRDGPGQIYVHRQMCHTEVVPMLLSSWPLSMSRWSLSSDILKVAIVKEWIRKAKDWGGVVHQGMIIVDERDRVRKRALAIASDR